ncbi:MAG: nucleotide-binding protein [Deltaproteobacteria bacterium]|nr:nucleotide-binding protein [Deltaproteobacteria bacterium]MBW2660565.1 nucleotide-binding protein [Deltaproteobacteria bacterium]
MQLENLTFNNTERFINIFTGIFATIALFGFVMFVPGCDKTETPKNESSVADKVAVSKNNITISKIKENFEIPNIQNPVLKGTIIEFQDVKDYTYLHLKDSTGDIWAAIPKTPVETEKKIELSNIIVMKNFQSKTLDKTFDIILFAVPSTKNQAIKAQAGTMPSGKMPPGMMPAGMPGSMPQGSTPNGMGDSQPKVVFKDIKIIKATGKDAYNIEEVYSKKKELSKKTVTVRAKVVKFLPGVMGKNWIHIQDGTGSSEAKTHDITVSTLDTTEVGDEVIVHGTLEIDKNFGSMHSFVVIIEDASLTKVQ